MTNEVNEFYTEVEATYWCYTVLAPAIRKNYGKKPPAVILQRLWAEWQAVERLRMFRDVAALYDSVQWLKEKNYDYCMAASTGASLLLYLLGVTSCNPMPEHHDIPWQSLWGYGEHAYGLCVDVHRNIHDELANELLHSGIPVKLYPEGEIVAFGISFRMALDERTGPARAGYRNGEDGPIIYREDVYRYLLDHGFSEEDAWKEMNDVRKGKGFSAITEGMRTAPDHNKLELYEKVSYLTSKADAVEWEYYQQRCGNNA